MTSTYDVSPEALDLTFVAGDDFSMLIDFSIDLTGYSFTSYINGTAFTIQNTDLAGGQVTLSLTDTQTSALGVGSFDWYFTWTTGSLTRTVLKGTAKVVSR